MSCTTSATRSILVNPFRIEKSGFKNGGLNPFCGNAASFGFSLRQFSSSGSGADSSAAGVSDGPAPFELGFRREELFFSGSKSSLSSGTSGSGSESGSGSGSVSFTCCFCRCTNSRAVVFGCLTSEDKLSSVVFAGFYGAVVARARFSFSAGIWLRDDDDIEAAGDR